MPEVRYSAAVLADKPEAYWRLGDYGTAALDRRGWAPGFEDQQIHDGAYANAPALQKGLLRSSDADRMVVLNGVDEYVTVGGLLGPLNLIAPCTVEAWARLDAWPGGGSTVARIASKAQGTAAGWGFGVTGPASTAGAGCLRWTVYGVKDYDSPPGTVKLGVPYHLAARFNADLSCDLFVNGALAAHVSNAGGAQPAPAFATILALGQKGESFSTEFWNGALDEVALYTYALADARVAAHYAAGTTPGRPLAYHKLEVAWGSRVGGIFQLDFSQLDGADVLAESGWSQTFSGPNDDCTADLLEVEWGRGRSDDLGTMQALEATVTLKDPDGKYNPQNPGSIIPTNALDVVVPLRPVRLTSFYDDRSWPRFYGFIRSVQHEPQGRRGVTQLEVSDLFLWLSGPDEGGGAPVAPGVRPAAGPRRNAPIPIYTGDNNALGNQPGAPGIVLGLLLNTDTGSILGELLDAIGFTDQSMRLLDVGDQISSFQPDGIQDAMQIVEDLMAANRGACFVDKSGRFVFEDRNHRASRASEWLVSQAATAVAPGTSVDGIVNRWRVVRQYLSGGSYTDGVEQVAADLASQQSYGTHEQQLSSRYFKTDAQAADVSNGLLARTKDPRPPVWGLEVDDREHDLLLLMLGAELEHRLTAPTTKAGDLGDFYVESVHHHVQQGRRESCSLALTQAPATLPFILDSPTAALVGSAEVGW